MGGLWDTLASRATSIPPSSLRTSVIKDGVAYVQAGGGVVADSTPEDEYQETLLQKAGALLRAIDKAEGRGITRRRGGKIADRCFLPHRISLVRDIESSLAFYT